MVRSTNRKNRVLRLLDFNVVNLALPAIRQNLNATSSDAQFVIPAYAATYVVFLITGGRLGDCLGSKRMFVTGVAGFTLASVLCGLAWSPAVLIAGRIPLGLTATAIALQVLASIRVLFPAGEQGRVFALYVLRPGLPTSPDRSSTAFWCPRTRSGLAGRRLHKDESTDAGHRGGDACNVR